MNPALIIVDVQRAIDDPSWGVRNNPHAEANIARLLARWRERDWPLFHVKHDSREPQSTYRPGQPGNNFKPEAMPLEGEPVIAKETPSALVGTDLEAWLRGAGIKKIVVAGVITNNSIEATVRHAACLGFEVTVVEDACFTFGRKDWHGRERSADEVHAMSLANLSGEYAVIATTAEVLA